MEMEDAAFSVMDLEKRTYRYLQQLAKSLHLPSNVKKVHLVNLIHAKKFKTENEVDSIIQKVKEERRQQAWSRLLNKKNLQNREISSTSLLQSPPITRTPKRPVHAVLRYSPDFNPFKANSRPSFTNVSRSIASSDRVLRSFNLKALRKSYGAVNVCHNQLNAYKARNQSPRRLHSFEQMPSLPKINAAAKCIEARHRPSILNANTCLAPRNVNPRRYLISQSEDRPKRQRTISGIYPLLPQEIPHRSFDHIRGVSLRRTDGRLSTINALVQKRNATPYKPPPKHNEISIQDLLNTIDVNLDTDIHTDLQPYPNMTGEDRNGQPVPEMTEESYSVYYHKKIRSEQVRYQRMACRETEEDRLPRITDVFSRFNGDMNRNVTQPLYVQVSDVPETLPNYTHANRSTANATMLETLYNFKNNHLPYTPLLQIATTSNTKCVYSTPVIATAMAQHTTSLIATEPYNIPPYEPDNHINHCSHDAELPHFYDLMRHTEPEFVVRRMNSGDVSTAASSLDTSQSHIDGSATIPEMVEDALEIISQDGDYMEQIGMDIRVQCVLCSWAGPKIILEFHIRKEHPTQIHKLGKSEYSLSYTLGNLVRSKLWSSQVLECAAQLYVLSAKYESPDCLMATLSSLSSEPHPSDRQGTITIYSKVTGEPYIWEGRILPLPPNLPYENDLTCLSIPLSKLDLLPNSANLKLHNEELVLKSPSKVVVGQPEFNDIHVSIFVAVS